MFSHHAYYVEGSLVYFDALLNSVKKSQGLSEHDPGLSAQQFERFSIDDARELTLRGSLRHISTQAIYVLGVQALANDAQQALLKLFEEPQINATYIVLMPYGVLMPTLRSRMLPYPHFIKSSTAANTEVAAFITWDYKKRSEWITRMLKDNETARAYTVDFLNDLEVVLVPHVQKSKEVRLVLEDIARFRPYLLDTAPSVKMILEHFATTMPKL